MSSLATNRLIASTALLLGVAGCGSSFSTEQASGGTTSSGGTIGSGGGIGTGGVTGSGGNSSGGTSGAAGSISTGGSVSTGGGTGTGGRIGTGGVVGTGGVTSTGGTSGTCDSNITFTMLPPTSGSAPTQYCVDATCGVAWLSITPAAGGAPYMLRFPCGTVDCATCQATPCPNIACIDQVLSHNGVSFVWTGSVYVDVKACGSSCVAQQCVPPGRYIVKMCAYKAQSVTQGCIQSTSLGCSDPITIELPNKNTVTGQLP